MEQNSVKQNRHVSFIINILASYHFKLIGFKTFQGELEPRAPAANFAPVAALPMSSLDLAIL